ncbi:MAG: ferredoxin [Bacteroidales bacterium]
MAITKVWIDEGCTACCICEEICPEVFQVTDECHVQVVPDLNQFESGIRDAADSCPVEVIKVVEV